MIENFYKMLADFGGHFLCVTDSQNVASVKPSSLISV